MLKPPSAGPARTRRDRPATLTDVAREAGVGRWIAGAILNGGASNSRCAPETAAQIRAAAAKLEYRPNFAARLLSGKRSHTFRLLVASAGDPLVSFLVQDLHAEAVGLGCSVLIANTVGDNALGPHRFKASVEEFARRGVDGVFRAVHRWWPGDRPVLLKRLRARGIRVPDDVAVVGYLNHYLADWVDPPLTTIDLDQAAAAKAMVEMAERLVEQGEDAAASSPWAVLVPPRLIVRVST